MRIFRVEHFRKRFSILIRYCMGILEWFRLGKSYNTEKSYVESSLRERDDCVVNKFNISLVCGGVCGLSAQAADTVMFCFWVSKFTFPNGAKNLKLNRGQRS